MYTYIFLYMHMFSLAVYIYSLVKKVLKDMNENLELQE